jgi:UPF0716 protein FxsA
MRIVFPAFLVLVFAEIAAFIVVGKAIGVLATLALTLAGMVAGVVLLRRQGASALMRMRSEAEAGRVPARPLFDAAAATLAAFLMILPGFISDVAGILLFLAPVRAALWRWLGGRIKVRAAPLRRERPAVVELDASEYGSPPRPDSPWRQRQ